jgi:DNA-binding CsgD family transcriptional regulator
LSALREAAVQRHVVVAVDDVQWLDASSRVVLTYALRNLGTGDDVSVLTAVRAGVEGPLALRGSELARARTHLSLRPLSVGAVHRIVRGVLGTPLSRPRLVRLHSVSGGNPLHAIELARVAVADPHGDELEVPESLADVLRARLAPLSPEARALLVAVAAAGDVRPSDLGPLVTEVALDEAIGHEVVVVVEGRIRFTHPLLGSTVTGDAGELARSRVHRQLADLAATPEERARHLALGGSGPDERVAAELERAADSSCRRGARATGASLYEQSAALTPPDEAHSRDTRLVAAARAHFQAGEPERARALLESVAASETPMGFEALCVLGTLLDETVGGDASFAAFEAALAADDLAVMCEAHRGLAQSLAYVGDLEQSVRHAEAAVVAAEELGDEARLAYALAMLAFVRRFAGQPDWDAPLERGLALEAKVDLPTLDACPSAVGADLRRIGFELDEARVAYDEMLRQATERGDVPNEAWCRYGLATVEIAAGRWDEAQGHADELSDLAEQTALLRLPSLRTGAHLALLAGDVEQARQLLDTVLDEAGARGELHNLRGARQIEGLLELARGDAAAAAAALAHAREIAEQMSVGDPGMLAFLVDEVEALAATGDPDGAATVLRLFELRTAASDASWIAPLAGRARGVVQAAAGALPEALETLGAAVEGEDALPLPLEQARTRLALGRVLRRAQRRSDAAAMLGGALARFEALGAPLWAERAREELARIGGRAPSSDDLTPTEQRIADLVAAGMTNREVAASLFVTPKTVESALTRVYRKLGVRSRTELAHRASELD